MNEPPFILIVDDDAANRFLAARILASGGYSIDVAVDGLDALAKIAQRCPDLVLMDLSMPGLDGWEATRRLRLDPLCAHVRVLAVTAHAMVGDRERAIASGCDDVVFKPFRPADLVAAVDRLLAAGQGVTAALGVSDGQRAAVAAGAN